MNHKNNQPGPEDSGKWHEHDAPSEDAHTEEPRTEEAPAESAPVEDVPAEGASVEGDAPAGGGTAGPPAGVIDEQALRQLLRGAVGDLEPAPGTLDHLRRAVPARRTRRRQALVGAVAALVLGGAALPALVHVATTGGSSSDRAANTASSGRTPGAQGGAHGEGSGTEETGKPAKPGEKDEGDKHKGDKGKHDKGKDPKGSPGVPDPDPSSTLIATSPLCTRAQLDGGSASAGPADANGNVYGSFRVLNVSDSACTVDAAGAVSASAQGGADATRISVVDHTSGDAAGQLPDPSTAPSQLILQPGQAFEVRFAWIPEAGGGTSGCTTTGPTPTPAPTQDGEGTAPEDPPASGGTDTGGESGGSGGSEQPEASVLLSYTPAAGDPVAASTTVPNACAGTVYRTGVLAG